MSVSYYIIRIYRREKDNPRKFVGIVEDASDHGGTVARKVFTNVDELWSILNPPGERGDFRTTGSGEKIS